MATNNNRPIGYKLSRTMFNEILKQCSTKENPYNAVMAFINEQYGLFGTVTQLSIIG